MLNFGFTNETKEKTSKTPYKKLLDKFYKTLKSKIDKKLLGRDGQIDLIFVSDDTIKNLNKEYRDINEPTDVISFAYLEVTEFEKTRGEIIVGDIFISIDTSKRQAKEKGHSLKKELEILFVHGLLHLFGFDHKTKKLETEMEKWAKKILS